MKNRTYTEIEKKITNDVLLSNVYILQASSQEAMINYSSGFGGVIFEEADNKYYILTASHAFSNNENVELIVLKYNDQTLSEYLNSQNKYIGISEYYSKFPIATVEYYDESYDLAILSFESETELNYLSLSKTNPKKNQKIFTISSPIEEKRNNITYGRILSKSPIPFGRGNKELKHNIIKHSAYINMGSSGSALLDENLNIVGINLGGGENIFKVFQFGMAIPSEEIINFIEDWTSSKSSQN